MLNKSNNTNSQENVFAGIVGALLFSLAGGVALLLLWRVGRGAIFSGLIGAICAVYGYKIFGRKKSIKGCVIATIVSVIVLLFAWHLCLSMELYEIVRDAYLDGKLDFTITFGQAFKNPYVLFVDFGTALIYMKSLLGIFMAITTGIIFIADIVVKKKKAKEKPNAALNQPVCNNAECSKNTGHTQTRLNGEEINLNK